MKWSEISKEMKGRTDNAIKNRYIALQKSDLTIPDSMEEEKVQNIKNTETIVKKNKEKS